MPQPNATVLCAQCGSTKPVYVNRGKTPPAFCSRECQWQSMRKWDGRTCEHCGEPIRRHRQSRDSGRFCSRECGYAHRREAAAARWSCSLCGEPLNFAAKKKRISTCYSCRTAIRTARKQAEKQRLCECGQPLEKYKRLCSDCLAEHKRQHRNIASHKRCKCNHRKRARRYGVTYTTGINWRTVIDRMGTTCGICGDPIDVSVRHPNPGSPTVDHIVPMARGGSHTWDNVQPAHMYCNSVKSDRDLDAVRCA
jgi:hypothetical protein